MSEQIKPRFHVNVMKVTGALASVAALFTLVVVIMMLNRAAEQSIRLDKAHDAQVCVLQVLFTEPEERKLEWSVERLQTQCGLSKEEAEAVLKEQ